MNKDIERFLDLEKIEQVLDLAKCSLEKIWQSGVALRDIVSFDFETQKIKWCKIDNKEFADFADEHFRKLINDKFKNDSQNILAKTIEFFKKENVSRHTAGYINLLALGKIDDKTLLDIMYDDKIKNPIDEISLLLSKIETEKNKYPEFLEVRKLKLKKEFEKLLEEETDNTDDIKFTDLENAVIATCPNFKRDYKKLLEKKYMIKLDNGLLRWRHAPLYCLAMYFDENKTGDKNNFAVVEKLFYLTRGSLAKNLYDVKNNSKNAEEKYNDFIKKINS